MPRVCWGLCIKMVMPLLKIIYKQKNGIKKAAKQQNEVALNYLGQMYENSNGVTVDTAKTKSYFAKAKEASKLSNNNYLCDL